MMNRMGLRCLGVLFHFVPILVWGGLQSRSSPSTPVPGRQRSPSIASASKDDDSAIFVFIMSILYILSSLSLDRILCRLSISLELTFYFDPLGAKVDQESMFYAGGCEVVDELDFVGCCKSGNGLEFDDQSVLDNQVGDEIADKNALVLDLDGLLGGG